MFFSRCILPDYDKQHLHFIICLRVLRSQLEALSDSFYIWGFVICRSNSSNCYCFPLTVHCTIYNFSVLVLLLYLNVIVMLVFMLHFNHKKFLLEFFWSVFYHFLIFISCLLTAKSFVSGQRLICSACSY